MTAEDVFRVLLDERSDIGLATVYRVLTQFEQAGILARSHFESGKAVYELNEGKHHDHLVCLDCGRVEEFYDAEIEKRQQLGRQGQGLRACRTMRCRCTRLHQDELRRTGAERRLRAALARPRPRRPQSSPAAPSPCWWRSTNSW